MARWVAGNNAPGFLPDDDPREHETWQEARDDVKADVSAFASDLLEGSDGDADYVESVERAERATLARVDQEARDGEAFDILFQGRVFFCMKGDD